MFYVRQSIILSQLAGLTLTLMSAFPTVAYTQEDNDDEVKIKDNSFLIEEAYNQSQGVVQHMLTLQPAWKGGVDPYRTFNGAFTQEWPLFGEKHQISYMIPFSSYDYESGAGTEADGVGDICLNYRYQVWNDEKGDPVAFAPRFTLVLPTGDENKGLGTGKVGYQVALPFSKYTKNWGFNFDVGLTETPGVVAGVDPNLNFSGTTLSSYYFGGSVIYLMRPNFNLMLEQMNTWSDSLGSDGTTSTQFVSVISPGFRWAPYTKGDTQVVLGLGVPIGLSSDAPDISAFFYMSFEHRFMKKQAED